MRVPENASVLRTHHWLSNFSVAISERKFLFLMNMLIVSNKTYFTKFIILWIWTLYITMVKKWQKSNSKAIRDHFENTGGRSRNIQRSQIVLKFLQTYELVPDRTFDEIRWRPDFKTIIYFAWRNTLHESFQNWNHEWIWT